MKFALVAAVFAFAAPAAEAASIFAFEEVGGNVIGTLSGSFDLTGAMRDRSSELSGSDFVTASNAMIVAVTDATLDAQGYMVSGPSSFGSGIRVNGSYTGDNFLLNGSTGRLFLSPSYISGTALSGTLTFAGQSFASLGVTPGSYIFNLPNDTLTVSFGPIAAVPVPASLPLLAGALGGLAFWRRRQRRV